MMKVRRACGRIRSQVVCCQGYRVALAQSEPRFASGCLPEANQRCACACVLPMPPERALFLVTEIFPRFHVSMSRRSRSLHSPRLFFLSFGRYLCSAAPRLVGGCGFCGELTASITARRGATLLRIVHREWASIVDMTMSRPVSDWAPLGAFIRCSAVETTNAAIRKSAALRVTGSATILQGRSAGPERG